MGEIIYNKTEFSIGLPNEWKREVQVWKEWEAREKGMRIWEERGDEDRGNERGSVLQ